MRVLVLATYRPADMALAQHPFLAIRDDLRAHGALDEIPLGFLERRDVERYLALMFPQHRFPAGVRRADPRQDRGQPAVHGRRGPLPARLGRHRRTRRQLGAGAVRGRGVPRAAGVGPQHDRQEDRAAGRGGPQAAASRPACRGTSSTRRWSPRRSRWIRRTSRSGSTRSSTCTCSSSACKEHEFPDLTLTLQYQFVHVLYQNALYRIAAADAPRVAERPGRARRWSRTTASEHAVDRGAAGRAVRSRARLRHERAVLPRRGRGTRSACSRFARRCRSPSAGSACCAACPRGPSALQHELGLQMIRGLALRMMKGWATPGDRAGFRARARALPPARRPAAAVPGAVGDRAVSRDQGRPAPVPRAAPTS